MAITEELQRIFGKSGYNIEEVLKKVTGNSGGGIGGSGIVPVFTAECFDASAESPYIVTCNMGLDDIFDAYTEGSISKVMLRSKNGRDIAISNSFSVVRCNGVVKSFIVSFDIMRSTEPTIALLFFESDGEGPVLTDQDVWLSINFDVIIPEQ